MVGQGRAVGVNDLRAWLSSPTLGTMERGKLTRALGLPECWPRSMTSAVTRFPPRPTSAIGDVVVVAAHLPHAALWRIRPQGFGAHSTGLREGCLRSIRTARLVALRDLAVLLDARPFQADQAWAAECFYRTADCVDLDGPLDGRSFELAICLATASQALGVPLPQPIVASALVEPDGRLSPASELEAKAQAVALGALGVQRFIVAEPTQPEHERDLARARAVLDAHGRPDVEILVASALHEVIDLVFDLRTRVHGALASSDVASAARVAEELFELTVRQTVRLASWEGVRSAVSTLCGRSDLDPIVAEKAKIAFAIAARNEQHPQPLDWPSEAVFAAIPARSRRVELAAHAIQSAASRGDRKAVRECLGRARKHKLLQLDAPSPCDLKAMGAIGRALAGIGRFGAAAGWLEAALRGWLAEGEPFNASFALCELLRVRAVRDERAHVEALCSDELLRVLADPLLDPVSRAYLHVAVGQARVLLGHADLALKALDPAVLEWELAPMHVKRARLRWLARAADSIDPAAAAAARLELGVVDDADAALSRVDAALASPTGDVRLAMSQLIGDVSLPADPRRDAEARRLLVRSFPGVPLADVDLARRDAAVRVAREHR